MPTADKEEDSTKKTLVVATDESGDAAATAAAADEPNNDNSDIVIGSEWWYKQQIDQTKQDIKHIDDQKKQFYKKQLELWGMYRYGLQTITRTSDLGDAPDAILPGNFP